MRQVAGRSDIHRSFTRAAALTAAAWGLVAAPLLAQGTGGKIEGTVRDQAGAPIANAQVFVVGTTFGTTTNSDGFYFINNVPVGRVTLQASFIGYRATQIEGIRILSGQTLTQDVTLEATPFEVEEITVIAAVNPLVPRDEVTTKQRVDGDYAKELPIDRVSSVLALQPGVVPSADGRTLFIRGGRADEAILYLDGVPVQSGGRNDLLTENSVGFFALGANPGVNTVSTVGFEAASITTGGSAAEFANAQSGIIAIQTRSGASAWTGSLSYETDEPFGKSSSYGFNRVTGSISGPLAGGLTFFLGGDVEGRQSFQPGKGRIDTPILVQAGRDTVMDVPGSPGDVMSDTTTVEIQRWVVHTGSCDEFSTSSNPDIANNYGFECQGVREPGTAESTMRLNTNLNWSYGTGSRLKGSATYHQFQQRYGHEFNGVGLSNYVNASGVTRSNSIFTLNWTQNLSRSVERALALEVGLSYQEDRFLRSALTPTSQANSYAPFGGFMIKQLDYVFDRDAFPIDEELIENVKRNTVGSRRTPYDQDNFEQYTATRRYRTNPYGLTSLWPDAGGGPSCCIRHRVNDENRWVARATLDWQVDRLNRVKLGGEYLAYSLTQYQGVLSTEFTAYDEQPVRWNAFVQDRLDLGDVVLEAGLRYDYFRTNAERPFLLDTLSTSETFNQYIFFPRTWGYEGFGGTGTGPAECAGRVPDPSDPGDPGGCPLTIFRTDQSHDYLSPHLQVSFPVTRSTNFRLSYAHQVQTPDFSIVYDLNGSDLDFGRSTIFEFGIRHSFSADAVLDVSAYNKDNLANAAGRAEFLLDPRAGFAVETLVMTNADFGNVKGIDIRFDRRFGNLFNGTLAYTFEDAKNTGSDPFSYINFGAQSLGSVAGRRLPPPQAILPTDQSRPHSLAGSFALTFPNDWKSGTGVSWLENSGLFATFRFASGTAFTRCPAAGNAGQLSGQSCTLGLYASDVNGARLPMLKQFNLRLTKGFGLGGVDVTGYLDIRNLFNFTNNQLVFAVTNSVIDETFRNERFTADSSSFLVEANANGARTAAYGMALPSANEACGDWVDQGGLPGGPSCYYLIRAEQRYGNGDRVFTIEEQRAASHANYDREWGAQWFNLPGRDIRLGVELNF